MRADVCITIALLSLSIDVDSARILGLFPHTGRSHQMVFEPFLRRLAERGHRVTVVSFFPLKNPPANYTDVSLEGLEQVGLETVNLEMFENRFYWLKMLGLQRVAKSMSEFYPLAEMAVSVCEKLVDFPPLAEAMKKEYDLMVIESFNSDCMNGLAHIYGIDVPVVALSSCDLMPWTAGRIGASDNPAYVPNIATAFSDRMTFFERMENTFIYLYSKFYFRYEAQVKEQELIEKRFGKKLDLQEVANKVSLVLVNTFHGLHGARPTVPGIVQVGGMHLNPNMKPIPKHIERFLNESINGVVLFSFGSLIKTSTMPKYKEEMITNVLSKLKQRVIWKYEDSDEEGTLTGNILRVKWIPQYELLQHKKVVAFVAHGGLLGLTEAISAGKPMVLVPFFGDQSHNAAAAERAGIAKVVPYLDFDERSFSEALEGAMSAQTRLNARRVSQMWKDRPMNPLETAVYWTERVARWGDQYPLYSASRELSFFEYTLLDVILAYAAAILIVIVTLLFTLKLLMRLLVASLCKESKKKMH